MFSSAKTPSCRNALFHQPHNKAGLGTALRQPKLAALYASMSPNEEYVLQALQLKFGGEIQVGENPPDAYLLLGKNRVAVEVSSLVEIVHSPSGKSVPRLALDVPAENMVNELNLELYDELPDVIYISIGVPIPINKLKQTKEALKQTITQCVASGHDEQDIVIEGNRISINVRKLKGLSGKKIIGYFSSRYSSANLVNNARELLLDRISTKSKKCKAVDGIEDYWLALFNHYWIADADIYKAAYRDISLSHQFSKVLIVDAYSQVECL